MSRRLYLLSAAVVTGFEIIGGVITASAATPSFVQAANTLTRSGTTNVVSFSGANTAGNLIVAYIVWDHSRTVSLSDTRGNVYTSAGLIQWNGNRHSAQVFYARNIAGGTNTVQAVFSAAISSFAIVYIHEYSGIDTVAPLDSVAGAAGTSNTMNSGFLTTTSENELLFGAAVSLASVLTAGNGFTVRSTARANMTEDKIAATPGSYSVTGIEDGGGWALQLVAFRSGAATESDGTPPSTPTGLSASAASSSQINLSWNPSTDNAGVAGYKVFRNSSQVATSSGTSYSDSGLAAGTTCTYTVAAYDAAGNTSPQSQSASATTLASPPPPAGVSFIQVSAATPQTSQSVVSVAYQSAQSAGNLNVIAVGWNDSTSNLLSVTDSIGNVYQLAVPVVRGNGLSQAIYYTKNIKAAASNTVTATFNTPVPFADVRALEYSGLDINAPFDGGNSSAGSGSSVQSGPVTISSGNELIFGAGTTFGSFTGPGAGFTTRIITPSDFDIAEDRVVTNAGTYNATASANAQWVMQVAAFRSAPGTPDTTAPSSPTGLAATAFSPSQINLSWSASTDNTGVTGYRVFRNSTQIATTSATSFQDTGLAANTTYTYTVAAFDAAGNVSAPSAPVSATTLQNQSDTSPPTVPANLNATAASSSQINLSWTASTDNVGVAGYKVFRNSSQIGTSSATSFSDTGLSAGTTYTYAVAAYDAANNTSANSQPASATTPSGGSTGAFPLKVSSNRRYLVDQNNVPFLFLGDSPQSIIGNLSEAEAASYFANRKARGMNAAWINLLCNSYTYCNSNGATFDGIAPFTRAGDISTPNEAYFKKADNILNLAAQNGIVVFLDPIETGGWLDILKSNGSTKAFNYGVYVGNRYRNFANIVWMSGNDFQTWTTPGDDAIVQQVARGIQSVDSNHLHTVELNYQASTSLDDGSWSPLIQLNAAYSYFPTYAEVLHAYNQSSSVVPFMIEANYEFEHNASDPGTPEILRRQEYWTAFSGAAGQFYGNLYTVRFLSGWPGNLDTPGAIQLGYVKALLAGRQWYNLVPDQNHTVVTAGYGTFSSSSSLGSNDYLTAARTPDGSLVMAYMPTIRTITVNMASLSGPVRAQWFDPAAGIYITISPSLPNSGTQTFRPPSNNAAGNGDWVLVLER